MAKVLVTGAREWSMNDDRTGREFSGFTVYYKNPIKPGEDGRFAAGYTSGKLSVKIGTELHTRMLNADYSKPFEVEPIYEFVPGSKNAALSDILF